MHERLRLTRHAAAAALVILAALMLWSSVRPELSPPSALQLDKLAHAGAFALLAVLASLAFPQRRHLAVALVALAAFGGFIEVAQSVAPGRTGSVADWILDIVGLGIGMAFPAIRPFRRLF